VIGLGRTTSRAVSYGSDSTSVVLDRASGPSRVTFVFAPGAGAHREHPSVLSLSQELCARGIDVARFNFWYREQGKATPDRISRLLACYESVATFAKGLLPGNRLVIGGRSMGGRVASMLVANKYQCDGLLLYAYPLLGANGSQRTQHLGDITVPTLCVCGTRAIGCARLTAWMLSSPH
jgi:uncharacterized protein